MKTSISIKIIALFFTIITVKQSNAQASWGMFVVAPIKDCGYGLGLNLFTPAIKLPGDVELRFGGEAYASMIIRRSLYNAPLDTPLTGDATLQLTNQVLGLNGVIRFSLPYSNVIVPYVDFFAGGRYFGTTMITTPKNQSVEPAHQSFQSDGQMNYGITLGLMASITDRIKFDVGLMYTYSRDAGAFMNIDKAYIENGALMMDKMPTPQDMFIAKVGFTFLFDGGSTLFSSRRSGCNSRSSAGLGIGGSSLFKSGRCKSGGGSTVIPKIRMGGSGGGILKPKT